MSSVKLKYLGWLIWIVESVSRAIDRIHRQSAYEDAPSPRQKLLYDIHRSHMLRRYHEKPCLCDLHNYARIRMFYSKPNTWFSCAKVKLAKFLIELLRKLCMAIVALIKWTEVDCPVHYPSYVTPGLFYER